MVLGDLERKQEMLLLPVASTWPPAPQRAACHSGRSRAVFLLSEKSSYLAGGGGTGCTWRRERSSKRRRIRRSSRK